MPLTSTVLFDLPQREIASLMTDRMARSTAVCIVTGFATPGGLAAILGPLKAHPEKLTALVVGSATYPGFEALDDLLVTGVSPNSLHVHLGHTGATGGVKNPFARFHPMMHSKVYYMELPEERACAFVGSHNVTAFALTGLNGEAAVLLEGGRDSQEFAKLRQHIEVARSQSVIYSAAMKDAYAWWTREYIDGMKAEMKIPSDWTTARTILLFASAGSSDRPKVGDNLYFEIPAGIEQIESLKTQTHLFLFDTLPPTPDQALTLASTARARYTCITLGAENKQGNREVVAHWRIDGSHSPVLTLVPSATYRPSTPAGMQQVRVEIKEEFVPYLEYQFERESSGWTPQFSDGDELRPSSPSLEGAALDEAEVDGRIKNWRLVKSLVPRLAAREKDEAALKLAAPESGSFILVSLRRRPRGKTHNE